MLLEKDICTYNTIILTIRFLDVTKYNIFQYFRAEHTSVQYNASERYTVLAAPVEVHKTPQTWQEKRQETPDVESVIITVTMRPFALQASSTHGADTRSS